MEQWKAIPGYEGLYEASTLGRIRTADGKVTSNNGRLHRVWKQRIMKIHYTKRSKNGKQNAMVSLWKDGKRKEFLVGRLVALSWCDGYKDGLTVNHIDGNTTNNNADNLEWVSLSENIIHAYKNGFNKSARPCTLINKDGDEFHFYSMQEASRFLGRKPGYLTIAIGHGTRIYSANGDQYGFV